jgi:hypothetical protein
VQKYITSSITHLTLPAYFNESIILPQSLIYLKFGTLFDQPIDRCIPNSVTHLKFGYFFNRSIKDCIPNSVTHLKFGYYFNRSIKGCIPNSVTHLKFGSRFNKSIKNSIPKSVTHLTLSYYFNKFKEPLPVTITHLHIGPSERNNILVQIIDGDLTCVDDPLIFAIKKYIPETIKNISLIIPDDDMDNVD